MSITIKTIPGRTYAVESAGSCTVTNAATGAVVCTVSAGAQGVFVATGAEYVVSDDDAAVVATFKAAPHRLRLLMGGGKNSVLPAGYTALEYLESTDNQYMGTSILVGADVGILATTERLGPADGVSIGGRTAGGDRFYPPQGQDAESTLNYYGWGGFFQLNDPKGTGKIESSINWKNNKMARWKNASAEKSVTLTGNPFSATPNILLFKAMSSHVTWIGRMYGASVSRGQEVVARFVPALDENGAPCMYDAIRKLTLYNKSGGDFVYPPVGAAATWGLRRPVAEYGQLTPHGVRRLYRLPDGYEGTAEQYVAEQGFKKLVENAMPDEGYWEPVWRETESELVLEWREVEAVEEYNNEH